MQFYKEHENYERFFSNEMKDQKIGCSLSHLNGQWSGKKLTFF